MMASSTANSGCTEETTAVSWKSEVSPGEPFEPSIINYICASIDEEVKKKIIYTLKTLPFQDSESVLVLFWAAKEIGDATVLTTTCQPFRLSGNNKELQDYYLACLDHKVYVYRNAKEEAAFGLAGWVYLYCVPRQTQNVHAYPEDQRPPCEDAIFERKWGSFGVPLIDTNKRVGVLEFVIDTPRDYSNDILVVQRLLEHAGLQTSIQIDRTIRTYLYPQKMIRKSKSFDKTKYCCLVPLFGLSSARAAEILGVKPSTFTNLCRRVGIPEWPCIRNTTTSITEFQIKKMIAEIKSFITPNADLISISDEELPEWPVEQTMTSVSSDSDPCLSELPSFDFNADLGDLEYLDSILDEEMLNIDHLNADLNSIWDEEFPESLLEQTFTTDYDALLPEPVGSGFMADLGEMEFHDTYAPSMEYLDSMYDEEMINIDHLIADLNSTRDEGFLVTTDSDAFLPERCSPNVMAKHHENEHQDNYVHSMDYLA